MERRIGDGEEDPFGSSSTKNLVSLTNNKSVDFVLPPKKLQKRSSSCHCQNQTVNATDLLIKKIIDCNRAINGTWFGRTNSTLWNLSGCRLSRAPDEVIFEPRPETTTGLSVRYTLGSEVNPNQSTTVSAAVKSILHDMDVIANSFSNNTNPLVQGVLKKFQDNQQLLKQEIDKLLPVTG
ncbi:unnamed protein product [Anisakis simplex]|uniref:Tobamovirus multiplication protein 2B n=1 Tax=Anisakis simplex TaxID=6269 RepID=A0A0M3KB59_ANISI|nr:unnamed protein product [Anisakis simplex]